MTTKLRAEAPTWAALICCYGLYAALTLNAGASPLIYVGLAVVMAFHSSLQHEIMHGHPTRWRWLNEALVAPPIGFAYPYGRYRDLHLAHHRDARLTDPYDDPESWYLDPAIWRDTPGWLRQLLKANNCAVGRMLIGPGLSIYRFLAADIRLILGGDRRVIVAWAHHAAGVALVLLWLSRTEVSALGYALACYGGLSLINLRSFLEHRAADRVSGRSVIVEDGGFFSLLFLNNNLHAVHHAHPELSWSAIPRFYREHRDRFLEMNGHYFFPSYWAVLRAHGLKPKEPPPHPNMRSLGR